MKLVAQIFERRKKRKRRRGEEKKKRRGEEEKRRREKRRRGEEEEEHDANSFKVSLRPLLKNNNFVYQQHEISLTSHTSLYRYSHDISSYQNAFLLSHERAIDILSPTSIHSETNISIKRKEKKKEKKKEKREGKRRKVNRRIEG